MYYKFEITCYCLSYNVQINLSGLPGNPYNCSNFKKIQLKKYTQMKLIDEDNYFQYYSDFFQGVDILYRWNKSTGEIMILFTDEIARKIFGFENLEALLQNKVIQEMKLEFYNIAGQTWFKPSYKYDRIDVN